MNRRILLFAAVAVLGAAAGAWYSFAQQSGPEADPPGAKEGLAGQPRPPFTLGAIDGRRVSASEFDGDVLLINFWATWCAPCREEMPMLADLYEVYADEGLSVVGIALDDVQQARDFVDELGIPYTNLVGSTDVMAANLAYGNRTGSLPYTVLVDRDGIVYWTHLGVLDREEVVERIEELL